ncbi:MAG TPA: polysaccharide deacetylase family protein [Pyrinomonadaceae bacterium]|nr:polysaccharide deacetylase family protein [Pyrinomonadaceae bacterium]
MHSVLVYHTISQPAQPLPGDIDIPRHRFEQQLRWLSRRQNVGRLEDTLSDSNKKITAITFDDGFRDNLTVALPLLEKFNLPMTLFMSAAFVGRDGYLSPQELRRIASHPLVTIGAHGLWHRHFTQLSVPDARAELLASRSLLQTITGQSIDYMAWPFGECNEELEALSRECGYRAAWSVWKGSNDTYSRWRIPLGRRDNLLRFIAKVSGGYGLTKAKWHRYKGLKKILEGGGPDLQPQSN